MWDLFIVVLHKLENISCGGSYLMLINDITTQVNSNVFLTLYISEFMALMCF